jgi:hypothetical protein
MSLDKLHQLVGSLAKSIEDNEKLAVPILSAKLARCLEEYPGDKTIGLIARVVDSLADNNLFIKRSELKDLYKKYHSYNTKFADLFIDELGTRDEGLKPKITQRIEPKEQIDIYEGADPVLYSALSSAFDKNIPLKMYSEKLANVAEKDVASTLAAWNLRPVKIGICDGNDRFLVIKADYDTPKGITSIYVPVSIDNNKVCEALLFVGNGGPQDLNYSTLKSYINKYAGCKLQTNGAQILQALIVASSEGRDVSGAELALIKLNASRQENCDYACNQIIGQKIEPNTYTEVTLPRYAEADYFEKYLTSSEGAACFKFGEDNVKIAGDNIYRELISYGYKYPQIKVTNSDVNTIFYGVSLDSGKVAFTVPVKIEGGKLLKPNIMICNGSVSALSQDNIVNLYVNNETDYKVAAAASPQFGLTAGELLENIKVAIAEGNNDKAEDALNVLANSGDSKAYAFGFQAFVNSLSGKVSTAEKSCCSNIIKNSTSKYEICAHTGLPIHKVYQDKHGNCHPLYRKGMDESYEGGLLTDYKLFW